MKIKPIGKYILIGREKEKEPEPGKLIIPKTKGVENIPKQARLFAIGNDATINAQVDDLIFVKPYNQGIQAYEDQDYTYHLITAEDIMGVYV